MTVAARYCARRWRVYSFPAPKCEDTSIPKVHADDLIVCHEESQRAESCANLPQLFLLDLELAAAGLEPYIDGYVYRLTAAWHDHPSGSIVVTSHKHSPAAVDQVFPDPEHITVNVMVEC